MDILPPPPLLAAFITASFLLAVTPGPAVLYIIARSITQGRASGFASIAGVAMGNFGNMLGASLGLAALFAVSTTAFLVMKYLGAAYLIFIGLQMIRASGQTLASQAAHSPQVGLRKIFRDGFLVALFNPKTALFFVAFLPQFLDAHGPHLLQSVLLGAIFVVIAVFTDALYVLGASAVRRSFAGVPVAAQTGKIASGSAFIGLGILTALTGQKPSIVKTP